MEIATFALNNGCALVLGMVLGLERQYGQHPAGLRTHTLVCLGAALFVSMAHLTDPGGSPTRVAAQVVSGIGFLGGGVILREGFNVRGMNTAATLWCSAAVGTLAGGGLLGEAALGTFAVLLTHVVLRPIVRTINTRLKTAVEVETLYRFQVQVDSAHEGVIRSIFSRHINAQPHMALQGLSTLDTERHDRKAVVAEIYSAERNDRVMNDLASRFGVEPSVSAVSWEKTSR